MSEIEYEVNTYKKFTIKAGDIVRIRPKEDIYNDYRKGLIDCGWNDYMYELCGNKYVVTEQIAERANQGIDDIFHIVMPQKTVGISLSMLELVTESDKDVEEIKPITLVNAEQDNAIIEEMIKKVDVMRFRKLLSIAGASSETRPDKITDKVIMKYLTNWAKAKYDIYLLFDRNLSINKQVDIEMDDEDMYTKMKDLARAYPQYANMIYSFNSKEFLNNESLDYNITLQEVYPDYKKGTKLSKVIANLVTDRGFSDAVANMMEDRKIKSNIALSIDPYDYFTMSVNNYGWESCQKIGSGNHGFATGAGSTMLDDVTIIAYRHSGKNEEYTMSNIKFSGNSKSWRQCIYIDKEHCSFIAGREYPSEKNLLAKEVRLTLEHKIGDYLNIDNDWIVTKNGERDYAKGSENLYHDVSSGYNYRTAYLRDREREVSVRVGRNTFCVICGKVITGNHSRYICQHC